MHIDTMLEFGALFDLAKYFEHTEGAGSPEVKFGDTLFISKTNRARKLKFGTRVGIYAY